MIPKECKRLAEVDFPIAIVSKHSAREKSIRHGHPSTLHLWWARRPLAACRSMLLALLLPDPCDPNCPEEFNVRARRILPRAQGTPGAGDLELRNELLRFIGQAASWDNASNPVYAETARALVKAAHGDETPLVVDPFAGGGSIPLEALRLGCDVFASDLNPVACQILQMLLEDLPRTGLDLVEKLRDAGAKVRSEVETRLSGLYPFDHGRSQPLAYIWARTVICDSCGAEIPLVRSFWLCSKTNRKRALRFKVNRNDGKPPYLTFDVFEPTSDTDVPNRTVSRVKASCLCCQSVLSAERVRAQLSAQHGGANPTFDLDGNRTGGALLLAVVTLDTSNSGRQYRAPVSHDYEAVYAAKKRLDEMEGKMLDADVLLIPDEEIPRTELRRISLPLYGVDQFRQMFTYRQLVTLATLATTIRELSGQDEPVNRLLTFALDKTADLNNANTPWKPDGNSKSGRLLRCGKKAKRLSRKIFNTRSWSQDLSGRPLANKRILLHYDGIVTQSKPLLPHLADRPLRRELGGSRGVVRSLGRPGAGRRSFLRLPPAFSCCASLGCGG
jgi:putative DNA methylase